MTTAVSQSSFNLQFQGLFQYIFQELRKTPETSGSSEYYVSLFLLQLHKDSYFEGIDLDKDIIAQLYKRLEKSEDIKAILLRGWLMMFKKNLQGLQRHGGGERSSLASIIKAYENLDVNYSLIDYKELFREAILYVNSYNKGHELMWPREVGELIGSLDMVPPNAKVYNPFARQTFFDMYLKNVSSYTSQDISEVNKIIADLRFIAHENFKRFQAIHSDPIKDWNPNHEVFDLIIATPPMGMIMRSASDKIGKLPTHEGFVFYEGLKNLSSNGVIINFTNTNFLHKTGADTFLRTYLVDGDLLDTVIYFPKGVLPNTAIPFACIIASKKKRNPGYVRFVDAGGYVDASTKHLKKLDAAKLAEHLNSDTKNMFITQIPNADISAQDYNLLPMRYLLEKAEGIELRMLLKAVKKVRATEDVKGAVIKIRDLRNDPFDFKLNLTDIEFAPVNGNNKIAASCLLISSIVPNIKPTYFEYQGVPIYAGNELFALSVNTDMIDINYLVQELHSTYVNEQLVGYGSGSTIQRIRLADLLNIKIDLPSLNVQKSRVEEQLTKAAEGNHLVQEYSRMLLDQNTYLRHALAGPVSNMKGAIKNVKALLEAHLIGPNAAIMGMKLTNNHPSTLRDYLNMLDRDIDHIDKAVGKQLKVGQELGQLELRNVEAITFFQGLEQRYKNHPDMGFDFKLSIGTDGLVDKDGNWKQVIIKADEFQLNILFDNLIENAVTHAFSEGVKNRIEVFVMFSSELVDSGELSILVSNNGKPLPQNYGFDSFIRKGSSAGIHAGTGYGGFLINEIIKKHNGRFDIIDETGPEGLPDTDLVTSFEICLPITEIS